MVVLTALALAQGCGGGATPAAQPQTATAAEPETAPAAGPDSSLTADPETAPAAQPDAAPSPTSASAPSPLPTPTAVLTEEVDPLNEESLLIFDYDQQSPIDVQEVSVGVRDGVSVYDINYASPKGGRVPAFLLVPDKETKAKFEPSANVGQRVVVAAKDKGLLLRPIGDTIAMAPPLVITVDEVDALVDKLTASIEVLKDA